MGVDQEGGFMAEGRYGLCWWRSGRSCVWHGSRKEARRHLQKRMECNYHPRKFPEKKKNN